VASGPQRVRNLKHYQRLFLGDNGLWAKVCNEYHRDFSLGGL